MPRRLRVAVVTNIPTPYRKGFFAALDEELGGELVVFYCARAEPGRQWAGEETGEGYAYRFLPGVTLRATLHLNPALVLELVRGRFDVVVVGGYGYPSVLLALAAARLRGLPAVMWLDGSPGGRGAALKRRVLAGVAGAVVTAPAIAARLQEMGVPPAHVHVVPLTVDVDAFRAAADARPGARAAGTTVLFVGRFIPKKNLFFAVELARRVRDLDVRFVLAGEGPQLGEIRGRVAELGLGNVELAGPVPPARVPALYAGADLLLLPSYSEPWGAVVNEALAAGVPAMVSDRAGAASLVEHGRNGFVISPDDPAAAEGLLRPFAADASRRSAMRAAARESGAHLTHRSAARLFADALREAA